MKKVELMSSVSASPLNNLQGKVAGLDIRQTTGQPGAQPVVLIRGGSTDPANDSPLFVIDGVVRSNMNGLNQEDIESMEVLKDAASAAIYGAKAANGIILITTKQGSSKDGKATISASYRLGVEQIRQHYPFSGARDYLYASRLAGSRGINDANVSGRLEGGGNGGDCRGHPQHAHGHAHSDHGGQQWNFRRTSPTADDCPGHRP